MKKVITHILTFVLGALAALSSYIFIGDETLEIYLEETIVPNAVLALTTAGAVILAAKPIIKKVYDVLSKFGAATDKVTLTAEGGKALQESVEKFGKELLEEISKGSESFCTMLEGYKTELRESMEELKSLKRDILSEGELLEHGEEEIKEILALGFGNSDELMKKGLAKRIVKAVKKNEEG